MTLRLLPDATGLAKACDLLDKGELVAFPTETVYGLGADATNPEAVARIYQAKGRPAFNPLIAHVANRDAAMREGVFDDAAQRLAGRFWPGPLTLVTPVAAQCSVSELARAGLDSVGLRCPSHPVALALLAAFGRPVAGPSANRSGHVSPTTAGHVLGDLSGRIAAVIDAGPTPVGIESTIVGCFDERAVLLRPGVITRAALEQACGRPIEQAGPDSATPRAPGRLLAHYAPKTPVRLDAVDVRPGEAALAFGPAILPGQTDAVKVINLSETGDLTQAAARLYAALRELDDAGATAIAVAPLPHAGLGEAIADRLARAAVGSTTRGRNKGTLT